MAQCPAHDDGSPSLSIRDTGEKLLFYCFAGCSFREIADALGIGPLELDGDITATKAGRKIAKLSRRSHKLEAAFLVTDYGLSPATAWKLVCERLKRMRLPEVQEHLKRTRGKEGNVLDYFTVEIGLDRSVAVELERRYKGGDDAGR
ncbi:MAG: hypothetical protein AB7Q37_03405 [Pyrinomonadaceae bacterium]